MVIENVLSNDGAAFTRPAPLCQGIMNAMAPATKGEVTLTFENVPLGTYAIMVMHDANDNKRMDMENGMPTEDYGMSGDGASMGPPTFEAAEFELGKKNQEFRKKRRNGLFLN